jgi:hypothetical protein
VVFTLLAFLALESPAAAATTSSISSKQVLLSPRIYPGQVLTWFGTITSIPTRWEVSNCSHCGPNSYSDIIACSVTGENRLGYTLSRRVRSFLANQPHTPTLEHPSIIFRSGRAFNTDGTPLNDEPVCMFYSPAMYGSPPATIRVGTSWQFRRPPGFGELGGLHGATTVSDIDVKTNMVQLHIVATGVGSGLIDMIVSNGGVIESEVDRWDSHLNPKTSPRFISSPTDTSSWSIQHQSFAKLWDSPPSEAVPFNEHALPDIFDPNGHFISVWQIPVAPKVTLIRIWHFGPFSFGSLSETLSAMKPSGRDVLLFAGVMLLVGMFGRAAILALQVIRPQRPVLPRTKRTQLFLVIALGVAAAVSSIWWIYR